MATIRRKMGQFSGESLPYLISSLKLNLGLKFDDFQSRIFPPPALRTRDAGARKFVSMHVLVPDNWTVKRGHNK